MNPEKAQGLSPELQTALEPLLAGIQALSEQIRTCNQRIEHLAQESYPQVAHLTAEVSLTRVGYTPLPR